MYQAHTSRPPRDTGQDSAGSAAQADADALITCYRMGESGALKDAKAAKAAGQTALRHSVVELNFTSSVRFLQPGLLRQVSARLWNECGTHVSLRPSTS